MVSDSPAAYESISLPEDCETISRQLVLSYLVHNCYGETAKSFAKSLSIEENVSIPPSSLSCTTNPSLNSSMDMFKSISLALPMIASTKNHATPSLTNTTTELDLDMEGFI